MAKKIVFRSPVVVLEDKALETVIDDVVNTNASVNSKADKSATLTGYGIADAYTQEQTNSAIATEVAKIVANAPEDFDTLKEVADWIKSDTTGAVKMQNDITALKNQIIIGTEDLEDGVSTLEQGKFYFVLEG